MKINFKISDFCITNTPIPVDVADKILRHLVEVQTVRNKVSFPIMVSKKSGYRPRIYEESKGRSGNGEHNFEGDGATDYTTYTTQNTLVLLKLLKEESGYTRICYYPNNNFIHCDYNSKERQYFEASSPTAPWVFKEKLK